jgi:serine/threonine protein kinase
MAPEQFEGTMADARSDIFALGCVLYELASGRRAFPGKSTAAAIAATAPAKPKPLEGVPEKLEELILHCLRKDPERVVAWALSTKPKTPSSGGTSRSSSCSNITPKISRRSSG